MMKPKESSITVKIRNVAVGNKTCLNAGTPNGLLEADNGDWYLVTHDDDGPVARKFAIVLHHFNLEKSTSLELTGEKLARGTWHGAFRLRLIRSFRGEAPYTEPGEICIDDTGIVMLTCCGIARHPDWLANGNIGKKNGRQVSSLSKKKDWCDFDAWEIKPLVVKGATSDTVRKEKCLKVLDVKPLVSSPG